VIGSTKGLTGSASRSAKSSKEGVVSSLVDRPPNGGRPESSRPYLCGCLSFATGPYSIDTGIALV
jgi:hypothetical protein